LHEGTNSPSRHLILLVRATDAAGRDLSQTGGPTLPGWCGTGDPALGHYAGLHGTAYARILEELWTQVAPTGAYWNPTRVVSDNRLAAFASDTTEYAFDPDDTGVVTVEVTLLFRRAFIELMEQKGWEVPDLVTEEETVVVP
jgi:hypothetical protein